MLRYLAVATLAAPFAFAQSSNPLIPSGISSGCASFLTAFNTDSGVGSCLTALSTASAAFAPGASTPSSQDVSTALTNLCSDSTNNACPESTIRAQLAQFWSNCQTDLASNQQIKGTYDVLWTLLPFKSSICSKDDSGKFCALASSTAARDVADDESASLSDLLSALWTSDNGALKRRAPVDAITPNITTFRDNALPFLFLTPDLDATNLCTSCTRSVITNYVDFAANTPYGPGFANSVLLTSQPALLSAINSKCPANFLGNAIDAAGGISQNGPLSGASSSLSVERGTLVAFFLSAAALAAF